MTSTIWNGYCTLADFKANLTPRGQSATADAVDDAFIEDTIERASRRLEALMGSRLFYPRVETRHYDIPRDRTIWFDDDLLEIITFTNGDDTTIASTEYILKPANAYPKYCLEMRAISTVTFEMDSNSSDQQVIDVLAFWGFHEWYGTRAWKTGSTLNEGAGLNTTDLTFTVTSGTPFAENQVIKIDNEIMIVSAKSTNDITVISRGDNGSTAATHDNGDTVYIWQYPEEITALALEIAKIMYKSRQGENVETTAITTAAGVIVTPRSLPAWAPEVIRKYGRMV